MAKIKSKHRNDIETRYLKSGLTVRVVVDDCGSTESPLDHYDSHVRLVTFERHGYVNDSGVKRREKSPFSEPEEVRTWAANNGFHCYPVFKYEHGNVAYSIAPFSCPWDSGQAGYLLLSLEEWSAMDDKADSYAKGTLESYSSWCNGEIYGWIVEDEDGETLESCWGYIGESDYALQEGLDTAEGIEKRRKRSRLDKLKTLIRNRVPLIKRQAMLESVAYG